MLVTILILIDGFLQYNLFKKANKIDTYVTILILIDGFLQFVMQLIMKLHMDCHNPYFNRWFSAMRLNMIVNSDNQKSQSLF